jgi:pimeloyl-ACP methyl ester carboxylesterase
VQTIALQEPQVVRKLILAGTGQAGGGGINEITRIAILANIRGALTFKDARHYLFFSRTPEGKQAARAYMSRLKERTEGRDKRLSPLARRARLKAIRAFGDREPQDLSAIRQPVLVANGDHDVMVPSSHWADMARRLPDAQRRIYPDAGHGGVFQYHEEFVAETLDFLG